MSSDQTSVVNSSDAATASTTPYTATTALPTAATTTTTLPPTTSIVTADPSTSYAPAPTTAQAPTTVITSITSIVTQSNTNVQTQGPIITTITSTQAVVTYTPPYTPSSTSSTSSASASQSALSAPGQSKAVNGGLSNGATIAIAVIIPILAVVGFVLFGLWFWRRRKAKKHAEEERKNDMAEYGFNPNNDPTLPVGAAYTDGGSEGNDDSGYRGWGTTSSANRKPSTTLGSNSRNAAGGQGLSETGSQPGGYNAYESPSAGAASDEPLVHGYEGAAAAGALGGAGAGAAMAVAPRSRHSGISGINRGISNASSAYSHGRAHSEVSSDAHDVPRPYYQEEVPYNVYNENQMGHGPYNDGGYGGPGDEPVIRDVQARRNTRIERAPTFPQQGQGGIAMNF